MKTKIRYSPADRELNAGTGLALTMLGPGMLILCYAADGHLSTIPAVLGLSFLLVGILILLNSRARIQFRQKTR